MGSVIEVERAPGTSQTRDSWILLHGAPGPENSTIKDPKMKLVEKSHNHSFQSRVALKDLTVRVRWGTFERRHIYEDRNREDLRVRPKSKTVKEKKLPSGNGLGKFSFPPNGMG